MHSQRILTKEQFVDILKSVVGLHVPLHSAIKILSIFLLFEIMIKTGSI